MNNCMRLILLTVILTAACWSTVFLSGCVRIDVKVRQEEPSIPGIECPARSMLDADKLWICGYMTEFDITIWSDFTAGPDCTFLSCTVVQCGVIVYRNLYIDDGVLTGTLDAVSTSIEFVCT